MPRPHRATRRPAVRLSEAVSRRASLRSGARARARVSRQSDPQPSQNKTPKPLPSVPPSVPSATARFDRRGAGSPAPPGLSHKRSCRAASARGRNCRQPSRHKTQSIVAGLSRQPDPKATARAPRSDTESAKVTTSALPMPRAGACRHRGPRTAVPCWTKPRQWRGHTPVPSATARLGAKRWRIAGPRVNTAPPLSPSLSPSLSRTVATRPNPPPFAGSRLPW